MSFACRGMAFIALVGLMAACAPPAQTPQVSTQEGREVWRESSFNDFADGVLTDGGANTYVGADGSIRLINELDLNQDGLIDLVLPGSHDNNFDMNAWIYWGRDEFGTSGRTALPGEGGQDVAVSDLNRDGYPDLVVAKGYNGTRTENRSAVYWGSKLGFDAERRADLPTVSAQAVATGDLNGDGFPEVVFASNGLSYQFTREGNDFSVVRPVSDIYWGSGDGYSPRRTTQLPTRFARDVAIADLNRDRAPDLVFAVQDYKGDPGGVLVYWGSESGYSADASLWLEGLGSVAVVAADLNEDGWLRSGRGQRDGARRRRRCRRDRGHPDSLLRLLGGFPGIRCRPADRVARLESPGHRSRRSRPGWAPGSDSVQPGGPCVLHLLGLGRRVPAPFEDRPADAVRQCQRRRGSERGRLPGSGLRQREERRELRRLLHRLLERPRRVRSLSPAGFADSGRVVGGKRRPGRRRQGRSGLRQQQGRLCFRQGAQCLCLLGPARGGLLPRGALDLALLRPERGQHRRSRPGRLDRPGAGGPDRHPLGDAHRTLPDRYHPPSHSERLQRGGGGLQPGRLPGPESQRVDSRPGRDEPLLGRPQRLPHGQPLHPQVPRRAAPQGGGPGRQRLSRPSVHRDQRPCRHLLERPRTDSTTGTFNSCPPRWPLGPRLRTSTPTAIWTW